MAGIFAGGKLKKVSVSGGTPVTLCDVTTPGATASWGADETIVLRPHSNTGLFQVPAGGGTLQPLTTLDFEKNEAGHFSPQVLPGGGAVLFTVASTAGLQTVVQSLETGERRVVLEGASGALYVPSGHLVYAQAGTLMAVAFDLEQLEVTGTPVPILQGVMQARGGISYAQLTFSDTGTLVYIRSDTSLGQERTLVWVDRKGAVQPLAAPPRYYDRFDLSPDGQRVALQINPGGDADLWVYDIGRETLTRLTFDQAQLSHLDTRRGTDYLPVVQVRYPQSVLETCRWHCG